MNNDTGSLQAVRPRSQVLGVSTVAIDDSALEAADPSGSISAKPVSFDSSIGRWDYNLSYAVKNLSGSASLAIGTYVVQSGITASGQVETGAILKPAMVYHLTLWLVDGSGNRQVLTHFELKTPKSTGSAKSTPPAPCPQTPSSNTTATSSIPYGLCIKKDDGTVQCVPRFCGTHTKMATPLLLPDFTGTETQGHRPPMTATGTPYGTPPMPPGHQNQ